MTGVVEATVDAFLVAVGLAERDAMAAVLHPDVRWANVPHPPVVGRDAVVEMLWALIGRCQAVRWDVVSAAYDEDRAHLERVDRFWIDGSEYSAACHGVFVVERASATIVEVRDYVDLGEWRAKLAAAGKEER